MKKNSRYFQCRLVIPHGPGRETWTMDWLSEKIAIAGRQVTRKDDSDGRTWTVGEVYRRISRSEEWIREHCQAHERWLPLALIRGSKPYTVQETTRGAVGGLDRIRRDFF